MSKLTNNQIAMLLGPAPRPHSFESRPIKTRPNVIPVRQVAALEKEWPPLIAATAAAGGIPAYEVPVTYRKHRHYVKA